ncbi:unnamed protein product [Chondrus crispus]|uniref:Uncharacterized protein n=1 Tax=Chondrus crispus TaxID=2769 RepID=R7QCQ7_CHOCR|nr:unnamed protein product [Chondrus crispus]CDF35216.1 unnamed protein product [Chondrus crispus]|eukprot:XP_005715035.1 unnamed protein product [Chondrus crispus]
MADVSKTTKAGTKPRPRRKKTLLRDVLRAEKVTRAHWQNVIVQRANSNTYPGNQFVGHPVDDVNERTPSASPGMGSQSASPGNVTRLTGEEEVCEVIDASENIDPNAHQGAGYHSAHSGGAAVVPSVHAVLLDDGLCAVRIVRADGSTQSVIIQPPDMGHDEW